jgi:hypothetical protein
MTEDQALEIVGAVLRRTVSPRERRRALEALGRIRERELDEMARYHQIDAKEKAA